MTSADSLNRQGVEFQTRGDLEAARIHYLAALGVDRDFLPAMANLAVVLGHQNKLQAAVVYLKKVLVAAPYDGGQLNNLGNMLMRLERYEESRAVLELATAVMPDSPTTWYNLALLVLRSGNNAEAIEYFTKAEALGANGHQLEHDKAHALLAIGYDLKAALALYEARWESMVHLAAWDFHIPEWKGEDLKGKSILFHAEQGFGDTIMVARFAKDLATRSAQVGLCLPPDLCDLFREQDWDGVSVLDMWQLTPEVAQKFDYQSPMYSAMKWLGIEQKDIRPEPYLYPPATCGVKIPEDGFKIGICWASGARGNEYDWRRRLAPLQYWLRLAELPNVRLFSLQKGPESGDIADLGAEALIQDDTVHLETWADTASYLDQLDLVISVDTAVVHLAGAMGKSTWMLSQYNHCWRWWNIYQESGKPWYESVSIIRQEKPGAWKEQLDAVYERLRMREGSSMLRAA